MIIKYLILNVFFVCTYGLSIGTVSGTQPLDKSARQDDLFPDWVPFKNKHGDELGFKPVKNKVKKRLAPPINFLIRNLEPDSDYFDKGGDGGSDSEDYFEKKDWSDLHRPAEVVKDKIVLNHTALSDIDGVVHILTQQPDIPLAQVINVHVDNNRDRPGKKTTTSFEENQPVVDSPEAVTGADESGQKKRENLDKETEKTVNTKKDEEEYQYSTESSSTTTGTSTEREKDVSTEEPVKEEENKDETEDERKKAALDSVDELKLRHAEEQKDISERAKEEDLYKELFQKYIAPTEDAKDDKTHRRKPIKPAPPDYDEYEDGNTSLNEKYKIKPIHRGSRTRTEEPELYTTYAPSTEPPKPKSSKYVETGKLSVFRNPQLYMIYDDVEDTTTTKPGKILSKTSKYSSYKGTTVPTLESDERISLIPADSKEGEPTLFLPTKKKDRRMRIKNTTPSSSKIDLGTDDTSAADTKQTVDVTGPTAAESVAAVTSPDAADSASDHHKTVEPKDYHKEKGGGKEHHSEYEEEHEEHGKKAYEGHHEDHKKAKGYHDKEDHLGKYDDHGGLEKNHHDESEHYGGHHHEEHGKKHAKYEESGKHSKGHSTKGSHDIHKKEEYEKKVEFFEEEGDEDEEEKHGGYKQEKEHKAGGHFKKGNLHAGHNQRSKGETGYFDKGRHAVAHKGHKLASGHDSHGKHHKDHAEKEAKAGGKKWIYHHGSPAKTANLVVIDRRGDQYYHGPHYYG